MTPIDPQPLTLEEALSLFSITQAEWEAIQRDVERGARRFWSRRGLSDMDHAWTFEAQQRMAWQGVRLRRLRKEEERVGRILERKD